jgi:uncharacterized protein YjcR
MRRSTAEQLLRLVKAKERLRKQNDRRPVHLRQTREQIDSLVRLASKEGRINDHGVILKRS